VLAPLIRSMRRVGLPHMPATLLSVLLAGTCVVGIGTILAFQLVAVTRDLPKYRAAIRTKVAAVRELTERPFARIEAELSAVAPQERSRCRPSRQARHHHGHAQPAAAGRDPRAAPHHARHAGAPVLAGLGTDRRGRPGAGAAGLHFCWNTNPCATA
jgi:hypothetical protein